MTIQETHSSAAVSAAEKASRVAAMSSPAALPSSASTARITPITSFAVAPPSRAILRPMRSFAWMPVVPVDRRDSRVAQVLRRAGLLDEAHAAVHLDARGRHLDAGFGEPALDDRDH